MKLFAKFDITRIDQEAVKGEEFDEALEQAIEEIEIDGWEVKGVSIEREKPKSFSHAQVFAEKLRAIGATYEMDNGTHKAQLEDPYPDNPKYTWRQMLIYWSEEIMKQEPKMDKK